MPFFRVEDKPVTRILVCINGCLPGETFETSDGYPPMADPRRIAVVVQHRAAGRKVEPSAAVSTMFPSSGGYTCQVCGYEERYAGQGQSFIHGGS